MAPTSSSASTTTRRNNVRVLVLGFMVGFTCTCFVRLARRSNAQLQQLNAYYEMASGALPYLHPDINGVDNATRISSQNENEIGAGNTKKPQSITQPPKAVPVPPTTKSIVPNITRIPDTKKTTPAASTATNAIDDTSKPGPPEVKRNVVKEFERQEGVVIATKIHSTNHLDAIAQSLCLLHYAYNNRVLYDIVVFSTYDIPESELKKVRELIKPAKLILAVDNEGLHERIDSLDPVRKAKMLKRCNVTETKEIEWYTWCDVDDTGKWERLAYTWQAEFRSLHLWTHHLLKPYKYMLWFDSDAFCTRVWERDPVAFMIQNDLAIFFDHFPVSIQDSKSIRLY